MSENFFDNPKTFQKLSHILTFVLSRNSQKQMTLTSETLKWPESP